MNRQILARSMNQWLEELGNARKIYGIRVGGGERPQIGAILPPSMHSAGECDWLQENERLSGTCAFEVQGLQADAAIRFALSFWPSSEWIALLEADAAGNDFVPEDGAFTMREPRVVKVIELC